MDIGALIRRLILFDHSLLESSLLREIPTLLQVFGYDGVMRLMDEPGFEIISGAMTAGSIGQNSVVHLTEQRGGILPLGSYNIACVTHVDPPDTPFASSLKHVEGPELNHQRKKRLKRRLLDKLMMHPAGAGDAGIDDHLQKLTTAPEFLGPTLRRAVSSAVGPDAAKSFRFHVTVLEQKGDFAVETNLESDLGLDKLTAHKLVERVLLGTAATHQRLSLMHTLNAVTGFRDADLRVFTSHLEFLLAQIDPDVYEENFERVVRIGGLPGLGAIEDGVTIDVAKLLELRHDPACKELRIWLRQVSSESEEDIQMQFGSVREKLAALLHSRTSEAIRFLATNGVGLVPEIGLALGPASSLADRFLVEKIVGRPGPVSFLNNNYRSIFET